MVLLMRFVGLRIGDVVKHSRDPLARREGSVLFPRRQGQIAEVRIQED
jgi:hypothetical protein